MFNMGNKSTLVDNQRNIKGSLGALIPAGIMLIVLAMGSLAADITHWTTVHGQLQTAADAAALAGAQDLVSIQTTPLAELHALQVAQSNKADGRAVANTSTNTIVTVLVTPASAGELGTCKVTAQMTINNWLANLFGRPTEVLSASATAAASTTVNRSNSNILFPLAVSIDTIPRDQQVSRPALNQLRVGDTAYFYINSQQVKNATFTSFTEDSANANWLKSAINQSLGLADPIPGFIPSVTIGDQINFNNGVVGQKHLADEPQYTAFLNKSVIFLPVMQGDPPYNQSREVVGFVAIKPTRVTTNQSGGIVETIEATILKAAIKGRKGDIPPTGNSESDNALNNISPSAVRLISTTN